MDRTPRAFSRIAVAIVTCVLAVVTGCARMPADDSAEAGFARDMATHHAQAVEMGFIVRDATQDESLRSLAADIVVTQSAQRGMFMSWLQQWGLPQASKGPRIAWMGSSGAGAPMASMPGMDGGDRRDGRDGGQSMAGLPLMAGMASDAELDALRHATGRDAEVLFLQLMIRHHEGGVLMARALLARSNRTDVVTLVRGIDRGQTGEIQTMAGMLKARGAEPYPTLLK
jgi:uncharacterized protein (DUF305 family)